MCLRELVLTVIVLARSDYMYVSVNIWFLCFVIAAVCCCIHVCSVTGEISQRKRRRRAKTTELKQLFSKNYLNSPGGFKGRPGFALFIPAQRPRIETSRIAFYVQRARLKRIHYVVATMNIISCLM